MLATSARLSPLASSFSWRIQMTFPSRSISNLFDLSRYLSIVFILTEFKVGWSNFRKSLTFVYPFTFCILVRKKSISSSVISFEGRAFFFFVRFSLIRKERSSHYNIHVTVTQLWGQVEPTMNYTLKWLTSVLRDGQRILVDISYHKDSSVAAMKPPLNHRLWHPISNLIRLRNTNLSDGKDNKHW